MPKQASTGQASAERAGTGQAGTGQAGTGQAAIVGLLASFGRELRGAGLAVGSGDIIG